MIKDTVCEDCPFKKKGLSRCPNYIETTWYEKDNPQPRIVKDCAPKRTMLMIQDLYNKTFSLQCQVSQMEGEINSTRASFNQLLGMVKTFEEAKKLEIETRKKTIDRLRSMNGSYVQPVLTLSDSAPTIGD